jgi:hypothetical protein
MTLRAAYLRYAVIQVRQSDQAEGFMVFRVVAVEGRFLRLYIW